MRGRARHRCGLTCSSLLSRLWWTSRAVLGDDCTGAAPRPEGPLLASDGRRGCRNDPHNLQSAAICARILLARLQSRRWAGLPSDSVSPPQSPSTAERASPHQATGWHVPASERHTGLGRVGVVEPRIRGPAEVLMARRDGGGEGFLASPGPARVAPVCGCAPGSLCTQEMQRRRIECNCSGVLARGTHGEASTGSAPPYQTRTSRTVTLPSRITHTGPRHAAPVCPAQAGKRSHTASASYVKLLLRARFRAEWRLQSTRRCSLQRGSWCAGGEVPAGRCGRQNE